MVNYANGKIYKIEPMCELIDDGDIYIGSTTKELSQRMSGHRNKYKSYKNGKKISKMISFTYLTNTELTIIKLL